MTLDPGRKIKRGPKPLDPGDQRRHRVGVYFNNFEWSNVIDKIWPDGMPDGTGSKTIQRRAAKLIRETVLESAPPMIPAINREAWAQLARTAANLNQYQKSVNEGVVPDAGFDLTSLYIEVQALRNNLLGINGDESED
jgi:urease gamma subunit